MLSVVAENISPFLSITEQAITMIDVKDEGKDGNDIEKEKAKSYKEKTFKDLLDCKTINDEQSLYALEHIYFKFSTYLSLPEIPPDRA
jgi:hypothetical protein